MLANLAKEQGSLGKTPMNNKIPAIGHWALYVKQFTHKAPFHHGIQTYGQKWEPGIGGHSSMQNS